MPSRPTTAKTSARGQAVRPAAPSVKASAKPAAKTPAKAAAKPAAKTAAKAPAKAAKPAAKSAKPAATSAAKTAAKTPAKLAAKAPARAAAKTPAKTAAKAPAKTAPAKAPGLAATSPAPDDVLILRDDAGVLGGAPTDEGAEPTAAAVAEPEVAELAEAEDDAAEPFERPDEPSEPEPEPLPEGLSPQEWFQREKARRTRPATADVMAEARALLLQAVAEAGPRRGRPVRVGAAAKGKPTKKLAPDEFELEEYRPGEKKAPGET